MVIAFQKARSSCNPSSRAVSACGRHSISEIAVQLQLGQARADNDKSHSISEIAVQLQRGIRLQRTFKVIAFQKSRSSCNVDIVGRIMPIVIAFQKDRKSTRLNSSH